MERLIEKRLQSHIDECNHRINKINDFILNNVNANQEECAKNIVVLVNAINAIEEYKKYKILEEQGKLLKLPCTVGDTVYVIPSKTNYCLNIINGYSENNRVYEQVVNRIEISENGYLLVTCDGMSSAIDVFYKNTWFLTRKEAEAVLKELSDQNWFGGEGK